MASSNSPMKVRPPSAAEIVESYRAAASDRPNDAQALTDLGWGLYGSAQPSEAVEQFKKALEIDAGFVDAHYGLGLAYKALGDKAAAVAAFDKAADLTKQAEDQVRGGMLRRLAHGHVNEINDGDWKLEAEIWRREA